MNNKEGERAGSGPAGALDRVLDAEKQAAERIRAARDEAARIVADGKQAARDEAERADRRIQALHKCARKALKRKRAEIDAEAQSQAIAHSAELSESEIEMLVARLARRLTGQPG